MAKPSGKHTTALTAKERDAALQEARDEETRVKSASGKRIPYAWSPEQRTESGKRTRAYMVMARSIDQLRANTDLQLTEIAAELAAIRRLLAKNAKVKELA
jgi:hypothetical protein